MSAFPRVLSFVLFSIALVACDAARGADEPSEKATAVQRKELQTLLVEFRKDRTTEGRLPIIERAAAVHVAGVKQLADIVTKEMQVPIAAYRQQFMKVAATLSGERVNADSLREVAMLRAKALATRDAEDLSKETIKRDSDPLLARLKEIILVDRTAVLAKLPELEKRRAALLLVGQQWEACAKQLQTEPSEPPPSFEEYLRKEEEIGTVLATPMDPATRQVLAGNAQLAGGLDPEEARCVLDLNMTRILMGLPPLGIDLALTAAARDHSHDMERLEFFSHQSPIAGKTSFVDRARRFNASASAENIALGASDGAAANRQWWYSPGHHKNMLADHKRVGVGRAGNYWTEVFGQ